MNPPAAIPERDGAGACGQHAGEGVVGRARIRAAEGEALVFLLRIIGVVRARLPRRPRRPQRRGLGRGGCEDAIALVLPHLPRRALLCLPLVPLPREDTQAVILRSPVPRLLRLLLRIPRGLVAPVSVARILPALTVE